MPTLSDSFWPLRRSSIGAEGRQLAAGRDGRRQGGVPSSPGTCLFRRGHGAAEEVAPSSLAALHGPKVRCAHGLAGCSHVGQVSGHPRASRVTLLFFVSAGPLLEHGCVEHCLCWRAQG